MSHALTADDLNRSGIKPMRKDEWEARDVEQFIRRMKQRGHRLKRRTTLTKPQRHESFAELQQLADAHAATKQKQRTVLNVPDAQLLIAVVNSNLDTESKVALTQLIADLIAGGEK